MWLSISMLSPYLLPRTTDNSKMILSPAPVYSSINSLIFGFCHTLTGFCTVQNFQFIRNLFNEICICRNKLSSKNFIYPKPINSPKKVYLSKVHLKRTFSKNCSIVQEAIYIKESGNRDSQRLDFKIEVYSVISLNTSQMAQRDEIPSEAMNKV